MGNEDRRNAGEEGHEQEKAGAGSADQAPGRQPQDPTNAAATASSRPDYDKAGAEEQNERRYGDSITEEDRQHSFRIEDERWARREQVKDWLKLAILLAISLAYHLLLFFLEPGLR